jgi:Icc-related predicted phosphoesterase
VYLLLFSNKKALYKMLSNIKILVISDLHYHTVSDIRNITNTNCDLCLLLDDIECKLLKEIKRNIKVPIYAVLGNHDTDDLLEKADIENINGKVIDFNGIKIGGIEGSSCYKDSSFVMHTQEESLKIMKNLPYVDILISHDSAYKQFSENISKEGYQGISWYLENKKPILHIHGHHHVNKIYKLNSTYCIASYESNIVDKKFFKRCYL